MVKGQKTITWKFYTVLAWFGGEIIGAVLSVVLFKSEDYFSMLPLAIMGAVGGYLIIRAILSRMPDKSESGFDFEEHH
jgi:mannitol-specific phosphotransferase system IIBC component